MKVVEDVKTKEWTLSGEEKSTEKTTASVEATAEASKKTVDKGKTKTATMETDVKASSSSESEQGEESVSKVDSEENRISDSPDEESTDEEMSD